MRKMSSSGYFRADNEALRELSMNKDLHLRERLLFYLMANEDHTKAYTCRKTRKQIADALEVSTRKLIQALSQLIEFGFIELIPDDRNSSYHPTRCLFRFEIMQQKRAMSPITDDQIGHLLRGEEVTKSVTCQMTKSVTSPVSREDKLEDINSPISPLTLKNSHPNPPSKEGGSFEGFSVEQVIGLVLKNMRLTESEYNRRKNDGTLTDDQLIHERLLQRERVVVGGKVRRFPLHLRKAGK